MPRLILFLVALFVVPVILAGCAGSSSSRASCKLVRGRPLPEEGSVRYEATFNVYGPGTDAVFMVDANEADRVTLPVGEQQNITLKCTGLSPGEHRFELQTVTKEGVHKVQTGVFVVK